MANQLRASIMGEPLPQRPFPISQMPD